MKEVVVVVSSVRSIFQEVLRAVVMRLALMLGGRLAVRAVLLRLEIGRLPEGSRRRAWLERDLARLEDLIAWLADPATMDCAVNRGMIAEAAVCALDAGRRAWIRWRWIYGWGCRSWRRVPVWAREEAEGALAVGRLRCALV